MRFGARIHVPPNSFLDPGLYLKGIGRALDEAAEDVRIDYKVVTQTWINQPLFVIEATKPNVRDIFTTQDIFKYIDRGTRVRHALMLPPFVAKTVPGQIRSRKGKFSGVIVNKNINLPGIQAREFSKVIGEKWTKRLPKMIQKSMATVAKQESR